MNLAYLGTPEMAVPPLDAVVEAGHDVKLVVTRPDARRGRRAGATPSPVKEAAARLGLAVTHDVDDLVPLGSRGEVDLGVVVAFGRIIKPHVLAAVPMVNLHFSLLPRWRGAAPVERALLAGDEVTGVCLMAVEEGLDTGGVHDRVEVAIPAGTSAAELRATLVAAGTDLLVSALDRGLGTPEPQVGTPTYAEKLDPGDVRLDWSEPPETNLRKVLVGGAWTTFRGRRLKVHQAEVVDAELRLLVVQPEGKPSMPFDAWRNGARPEPGERFE